MKTTAVDQSTTPNARGGKKAAEPDTGVRRNFFVYAANLGWQLAVAVLAPVIGGAELDKHSGGRHLWVFVGLGLAVVASTLVMWRMVRRANRLPVPKLTAEQKRAIRKSYEEEDDE
jgi:hypothetical protein